MDKYETHVVAYVERSDLDATLKFLDANFAYTYLNIKFIDTAKQGRVEFRIPAEGWAQAEQNKQLAGQLWPAAETKNREK